MNRALAFGALFFLLALTGFWFYDGNNHTLNVAVAVWTVFVGVVIVIHLFMDRGVRYWDAAVVGILIREIAWIALFIWFWYRLTVSRADVNRGVDQGLLDIVRSAAITGAPMLAYSVISLRAHKMRSGKTDKPTDFLSINTPTYRGPERRTGPRDRRSAAEIYSRDRGDD